jgi:site-specific DNA recombinase
VTRTEAKSREAHDGASECPSCLLVIPHFVAHPEEGPVLAALYERYNRGASMRGLAAALNRAGHWTMAGLQWEPTTLGAMLDTGFAAGLLRKSSEQMRAALVAKGRTPGRLGDFDVWQPGSQPPIISLATWEEYKTHRLAQGVLPPRLRSPVHALSGLMYCDLCACRLNTQYLKRRTGVMQHRWRCSRSRVRHPERGVSVPNASVLEEVRDWVRAHARPSDGPTIDDLARDGLAKAGKGRRTRETVQAEINRAFHKLQNLIALTAAGPISDDTVNAFALAKEEIETNMAGLRRELAAIDAMPRDGGRPPYAVFESLDALWDLSEPAELNTMLSAVVGMAIVSSLNGDRRRNPPPRVRVVGVWEMPSWGHWLAARRIKTLT